MSCAREGELLRRLWQLKCSQDQKPTPTPPRAQVLKMRELEPRQVISANSKMSPNALLSRRGEKISTTARQF
jgi:hypothetical protein